MLGIARVLTRSLAALVTIGVATSVACAVGQGSGSLSGHFNVPVCDKDLSNYDMHPDFFAADAVAVQGQLQVIIRVQNGGALQEYTDALTIVVQDGQAVSDGIDKANAAGQPAPSYDVQLERPPGSPVNLPAPPVRMSLSLRATCGSSFFQPGDPGDVVLHAVSGKVTFDAIVHGDLNSRDTNAKRIKGHFDGVQLEDPRTPGVGPMGTLTGEFEFFFQRGGPAQPFS